MEQNRIPLPPRAEAGAVTTFYAYEGGAARNAMLSVLAMQLAGHEPGAPVLMIDWDLESPALHRYFELAAEDCRAAEEGAAAHVPSGLLEFFETCRARLRRASGAERGETLADRILDDIDWRAFVERADQRRPLYLMRAGRFDEEYAERARRLDWEALFDACPALFRRFAARMARHFSHVLVASRAGRSSAVSVCTTLLADRVVGLFTPAPGSVEGLEGVVRRAIEYRCSHEDEQRPLLVYPLACAADGARSDPFQRWRRGDARSGMPGYQPRLENLLRDCYGWPRVNLDSYFDELQLALADAASTAGPGTDRRALARVAGVLAEWVGPGHFPWQSLDEIRLRAAVRRAREAAPAAAGPDTDAPGIAAPAPALADSLARLGELCRAEKRHDDARACLEEALALREAALGADHHEARAARAALAALLLESGSLHDARRQYDLLAQACARLDGADHPHTLAARSRLARALGGLGETERALALHEQVVATCEHALGDEHPATLDCLEDLAVSLARQHEYSRARVVYERVLDARRRQQGAEHEDTLRCGQRLAQLLGETGELGNARRLLEAVLRARERHDGLESSATVGAREALAEILAAQGDLAAVRSIQESLARTRERHLGAGHPETLNMQLRLASTLGQQGETEAARRLREQVAELRLRLREAEGCETIGPAMLSRPGAGAPAERAAGEGNAAGDTLGHKLAQLQQLIDSRSGREARALADTLRSAVLRPSVADPLRRRGAAMIKQVYLQEGDKDALLSFTQEEVSSLEGALIEARDKPMALR